MKKLIIFFLLSLQLIFQVKAQSPQSIKYQTVIRSNLGIILVNHIFTLRASIIIASSGGTVIYQEIHNLETNESGIVNINIGGGSVQSGNFNSISWGNNSHFLKIEIDLNAGSNFTFISTTQLLSVPYALYSQKTSNSTDNYDKDSTNELQTIQKTGYSVTLNKNGGSFTDSDNQQLNINGNNIGISNENTIALPTDNDKDSLNEIQTITKNGNIISLSNNGGNVTDNDNQTLNISGNQLQIINGNSITLAGFVDMDSDSTNEIQTLSKHGDTLLLSLNGGYVRIPNLHNLTTTTNGTNRTINITEGTATTFNIADIDFDSTNEIQSLSYANDTLNLSKSNFVKLPHGFEGEYDSLIGKPNLAVVALSGSYNDLADTISGNSIGDMKYWNGTSWQMLPLGQPNQFLQLNTSNIPDWKGNLPTLTTNSVSLLTNTIACLGGNITNDGGITILAKGICWDTIANPTTSKNKTYNGIGTGNFNNTLNGLNPATVYYVRAYAINMMGTAYGNEIVFTTLAKPIADIDGNVYDTVHIGSQIWMKQNLKTTHYRTGDTIPNVKDNTAWSTITNGAYCIYNNIDSNVIEYGRLYNFSAITDSRNLCPSGWHVPSDIEWTVLTTYLGGESVSGGKLKETGISHWYSPNLGATNETGFSALPGGARTMFGSFINLSFDGFWWSSTEYSTANALRRNMNYNYNSVSRYESNKPNGLSVRCLMNSISSASLPTITTNPISNIISNSVSCGGNISSDGGTTVIGRGVCWDTVQNPTFFKNKTTDSLGVGSFTSLILGLTLGETYYVRSYAINSEGIAYGNELSFTTALAIGDTYQGGIVAYILQPGDVGYNANAQHGIIAAPSDQGLFQWSAAYNFCNDLVLNSFSDWYLPNITELNKLYLNRLAIGGFVNNAYWSSTSGQINKRWVQNFSDGSQTDYLETWYQYIRAVRSF